MPRWSEISDDHYLCGSHETYWQMKLCEEEVENIPCQCNPTHLLHYRKEPIVIYRGKKWALRCAMEDMAFQFQVTRERNEELAEENRNLRGLCATNSARIGFMVKYYKRFTSHKEDCEVVEAAVTGRKLDAECTCGYDESHSASCFTREVG